MRRGHRERYKEFKLGVFYNQDKIHRRVVATGGNPEALGRLLRRDARRLGVARAAMIRYPESRAQGWDIGSGPTEGLCKTMAARLKGSGMRWDPAGASAMLNLTALEDSNEWEAYRHLQGVHQNWSHPWRSACIWGHLADRASVL